MQAVEDQATAREIVKPAGETIIPMVWDSLRLGKPLAEPGDKDQPAMLAYGQPLKAPGAGRIGELRNLLSALQQPSLLLEILDEDPQRQWSQDELLLIEQVTDQLTLALENAQLFEQTQNARDALQISVRYQKSVAQAVADLTERGFAAISDVLQLLGEAAQASRAYYMEAQIDFRGPYWHQVAEWHAPQAPAQINNPALRRISARWLSPWIERLNKEGYIAEITSQLPDEEREFMAALGARSILQFPVAGQHGASGCIGFEQIDYERVWTGDEIAALRTAASALANTIVRENLFNQLQVNLSETEAQYQASAQVNSANSYEEILAILRQFSILGHINASNVSINLFDRPWTRAQKPEWLIPISYWSGKSAAEQLAESIPAERIPATHPRRLENRRCFAQRRPPNRGIRPGQRPAPGCQCPLLIYRQIGRQELDQRAIECIRALDRTDHRSVQPDHRLYRPGNSPPGLAIRTGGGSSRKPAPAGRDPPAQRRAAGDERDHQLGQPHARIATGVS